MCLRLEAVFTFYLTSLLFDLSSLPPKNELNYETLSHLLNIKGLKFI